MKEKEKTFKIKNFKHKNEKQLRIVTPPKPLVFICS